MNARSRDAFRLLGRERLRRQLRILMEQARCISAGGDPDCIHDARVAARRLRSALVMFEGDLPAGQAERWRKAVRKVARGLGEARDRDVEMLFLRDVLAHLTERRCRPGIVWLLARTEQERAALQPQVLKAVARFEDSSVSDEMQATLKALTREARGRAVKPRTRMVRRQAERQIAGRLQAVRSRARSLADPEDQQGHHVLRVAMKHLRYTMEVFEPIYGRKIEPVIAAVKRLQTFLGDLRDCDVWVERLEAVLADRSRAVTGGRAGQGRGRGRLKAGLEYVLAERCQHRAKVFGQVLRYWRRIEKQGLWNDLGRIIQV